MSKSVQAAARRACHGGIVCALLALLPSSRVLAQDAPAQRVWVLDLQADEAGVETGQHLAALLREELASALLDHSVNGASGGCGEPDLLTCARWLGAPENITLVVGGSLRQDVEGLDVELWVVDNPSTGPRRELLQRLQRNPATWRQGMRELGVRAVAPDRFTGFVEIGGLQVFDRLTVDGAVTPHEVPLTRLTLPVGSHSVEVMRTGEGVYSEVVEVGFEQTLRPALGDAAAAQAVDGGASGAGAIAGEAGVPWLGMGLAAGGIALVAVATGLVVHGLLALQPELAFAQAMVDDDALSPEDRSLWSEHAADMSGLLAAEMAGAGIAGLLGLGLVATAAVLVIGTEDVVVDTAPAPVTAP
jgi:hypothetical protein